MTEFKLGDTVNFDGMIGKVVKFVDKNLMRVDFKYISFHFIRDGSMITKPGVVVLLKRAGI